MANNKLINHFTFKSQNHPPQKFSHLEVKQKLHICPSEGSITLIDEVDEETGEVLVRNLAEEIHAESYKCYTPESSGVIVDGNGTRYDYRKFQESRPPAVYGDFTGAPQTIAEMGEMVKHANLIMAAGIIDKDGNVNPKYIQADIQTLIKEKEKESGEPKSPEKPKEAK